MWTCTFYFNFKVFVKDMHKHAEEGDTDIPRIIYYSGNNSQFHNHQLQYKPILVSHCILVFTV